MDIDGVSKQFTIAEGNYTVTQLQDKLNNAFQYSVVPFNTIAVTYDDITNRFTFSNKSSGAFHITSDSTMHSVLGFESNTNVDFIPENVQNTSLVTEEDVSGNVIIDDTNNVFEVMYDSGYIHSYIFPVGMYIIENIASALNVVLSVYGITVTYNPNTEKITFSSTTLVRFTLKSVTNNILNLIGFIDDSVDHPSSVGSTSCILSSSRIVDLSGNNSFYLTTNLGLGNYSFLSSGNTGGANVLAKIQLTTDNTGIEFYNNLTAFKSRFYDTNITQLHIVLYDENFVPWIPLSDWSCVIEMTFYEKYDLTTKLKRNDLLFSS